MRAKITKCAEEDSLKRATQLAAKELSHDVKKSTVQSTHNVYQKHLASARLEPDKAEWPSTLSWMGLGFKVMMHLVKAVV